MRHRKAEIAGLEIEVLLIPQVNLAEGADISGGTDQHGAVEQLVAGALADSGDQVQLALGGNLGPRLDRRPAGHGLGGREGFLARLEHVAAVAELRQHDQFRASIGGAADQPYGMRDVGFDRADRRLHLNAGNPGLRVVQRRVARIHRTPLLCVAQNKKPPNAPRETQSEGYTA